MCFEKDQKHNYAHEHNCSIIIITLEGIEKIKTEKNDNETVWTITRACERATMYRKNLQQRFFTIQYEE